MPVRRSERSEEALRLRDTDRAAWDALHWRIRDEAVVYEDIRNSEKRNAERPPIGEPEEN